MWNREKYRGKTHPGQPQNRGAQKREEMGPKMDPELPPKWSTFGPPESMETSAIPCVFAQNGTPKGPRFQPKMKSGMSENWIQTWTGNEPKSIISVGFLRQKG